MTVGVVRARRHLFGRQSSFGTPVPAVRAYPFTGVPSQDEQWTDPEGDFGALYPVAAPFRGTGDYTQTTADNALDYNTLVLLLSGFFGGGVTPSGGPAYSWPYEAASDGTDDEDVFTREFGDDADGDPSDEPNDWEQNSDGLITSLSIDSPETGAGVLTASADWTFGTYAYAGSTDNAPGSPIPSITDRPDTNPPYVYLKDAKVYLDSDPSDIGSTQLTDALYKFTLTGTREIDKKWWVNGSGTFAPNGFKTSNRTLGIDLIYAKTPDTVGVGSEKDAWSGNEAINRYLSIVFTSTLEATPGTPFSWFFSIPIRYYTMQHGEIGGNTTTLLHGNVFVDDIAPVFDSEVVNTLAAADL
jgi:hypothetical protein